MNLKELQQSILNCTACPLREHATAPVIGNGEIPSKYLLLGEAPGREEDKAGVPFVGKAGQRLDKLIALAGMDINDCYLTNVCRCRPPGNRTPKKAEVNACVKYLWAEIKLVQPEYIIALGATPLKLFCSSGVRQMHGTMFEYELKEELLNGVG
jgi:DNA polymerase